MPNRQSRAPIHKIAAAISAITPPHHSAGVPMASTTEMQLSAPVQPAVPGLMSLATYMLSGRAMINQPTGLAS